MCMVIGRVLRSGLYDQPSAALLPGANPMESQQKSISVPLDERNDETLLHAIANGEVWAMELLYQRYSRILYSLIYRMVTNPHVAEDLLQEVFLSVWRRATSYAPQAGTVSGWLVSIARHRTIDYLRALRLRGSSEKVTWEEVEQDERTALPDVWDEAWMSVLSAQVRRALLTIPPQQRMVIELAFFQGWTHAEIAEGYHIPLGTVKVRIRHGLQYLKRALAQIGIDEL